MLSYNKLFIRYILQFNKINYHCLEIFIKYKINLFGFFNIVQIIVLNNECIKNYHTKKNYFVFGIRGSTCSGRIYPYHS